MKKMTLFLAAALLCISVQAFEGFGTFLGIGLGAEPNGQFTEQQFRLIAERYDLVFINKFHGRWDRDLHHAAARRLVELNPGIGVLAYLSASYRFYRHDNYGREAFEGRMDCMNPDPWILCDANGEPVPTGTPTPTYWVDLSNEEYREWALDTIEDWLEAEPSYAGVLIDNARPIEQRGRFYMRITPAKRAAWNAGLEMLLRGAKELASRRGKLALYNGLGITASGLPNEAPLRVTDGALHEWFCVGSADEVLSPPALLDQVHLLERVNGDGLVALAKVNADRSELPDREGLSRFCLGVFALGFTPEVGFYKFGDGYNGTTGEIEENALEIDAPFGAPLGPYLKLANDLYAREFENGWVLVNMSQTAAHSFTHPLNTKLYNGGVLGKRYKAGKTYTLGVRDAAFFLKQQ